MHSLCRLCGLRTFCAKGVTCYAVRYFDTLRELGYLQQRGTMLRISNPRGK